MEKRFELSDLIDLSDPSAVLREIKHICASVINTHDPTRLDRIYSDVKRLFRGEYPGYRASNTKYHDLEHTHTVTLATAQLIHGCFISGMIFNTRDLLVGISAALFHDVGLIQTIDDRVGSGAKYTVGHENRSIKFMGDYFDANGFSQQDIEDCSHLIMCTDLKLPPKDIPFRSNGIATLGKIVGSADLMAQIADRYYLEKLVLLFQEFQEAGVPDYDNELDLLNKTEGFYKYVARKRLEDDFDGISANMSLHFQSRWGVEEDLYAVSIQKNIDYLKTILNDRGGDINLLRDNLRRGGILRNMAE